MFEQSYVRQDLLVKSFLNRVRILGDGFDDLGRINFLLFKEFWFEDFVFFRRVMVGQPFQKEDKPIFPGTHSGEQVLNILLEFFGIFIFIHLLGHLSYIY